MFKVNLQPATVLHTRPYRNTSLLVDIFSPDFGRLSLVARGVRAKSRSSLQAFQQLHVSWSGKGELKTLTGFEESKNPLRLTGNALACGFYLNELIIRLLHQNDPHEALYSCYITSLQALAEQKNPEVVLRLFEKQLLDDIGYGLVLDRDIQSGEVLQDSITYRYLLEQGPIAAVTPEAGQILITGSCLKKLASNDLTDQDCLTSIKRLMRQSLAVYLDKKPLKSRELLQAFHSQKRINTVTDASK